MKTIMSGNSLTQCDNDSEVKAEERLLNWALHVACLFVIGYCRFHQDTYPFKSCTCLRTRYRLRSIPPADTALTSGFQGKCKARLVRYNYTSSLRISTGLARF